MAEELNSAQDLQLVRISRAAELLDISVPTLYRRINDDPDFPDKIQISKRCSGFKLNELREYIESCRETKVLEGTK